MTVRSPVSPLNRNMPIVDPDKGTASMAFSIEWQKAFQNESVTHVVATGAQTSADTAQTTANSALAVANAAVPQMRTITATAPITIDGGTSADLSANRTLAHAASGVTAGAYGDSTHTLTLTVDARGHVTSVSTNAISGGGGDQGVFWAYEQSATAGGSATANSWTTRVLSATGLNSISGASIASNLITLPAGTYDVFATVPYYTASTNSGRSCRLWNNTDSVTIILGTTLWTAGEARATLQGRFTLGASKVVALQGIVDSTAGGTSALGVNAGGMGNSVANHFSDIFIRKVA